MAIRITLPASVELLVKLCFFSLQLSALREDSAFSIVSFCHIIIGHCNALCLHLGISTVPDMAVMDMRMSLRLRKGVFWMRAALDHW